MKVVSLGANGARICECAQCAKGFVWDSETYPDTDKCEPCEVAAEKARMELQDYRMAIADYQAAKRRI